MSEDAERLFVATVLGQMVSTETFRQHCLVVRLGRELCGSALMHSCTELLFLIAGKRMQLRATSQGGRGLGRVPL